MRSLFRLKSHLLSVMSQKHSAALSSNNAVSSSSEVVNQGSFSGTMAPISPHRALGEMYSLEALSTPGQVIQVFTLPSTAYIGVHLQEIDF